MSPNKPMSRSCAYSILAGLVVIAALAALHGYWYATSTLQEYTQRCGAYPTLDEAIAGNIRHNGFDPTWFRDYIKTQSTPNNPYTWYVVQPVKPEYQAAFNEALKPSAGDWCGGSFYYHTKAGWVGLSENFATGIGWMDLWMGIYHLYGE